MAKTRALIPPREDLLRATPRESVIISAKCQVGDRLAEEVLVTDLSAKGCRLRGNSIGVTKAERVQLWIGDIGPLGAQLKWVKKGSLGLAFEAPLSEEVLRPLLDAPAPSVASNVVPLKRRA